jgi:hypothetical protein
MSNHRHRATLLAAACAGLLCAGSAVAAMPAGDRYATTYDSAQAMDEDGLALRAGQFTWLADAQSGSGPVTLLVNLQTQRGYLYRDGRRIAVTTLSTGLPGHDTPIGVFPIMGKEPMHHSRKYDNAPMPFMQRLTNWGHALHAGLVRNGPASHGCVRLPAEFARQLYSMTSPGDLVVISQDDSVASLARAGVDGQIAPLVGAPAAEVQRMAASVLPPGYPDPGQLAGGAVRPTASAY